jgi:hypothetical protein
MWPSLFLPNAHNEMDQGAAVLNCEAEAGRAGEQPAGQVPVGLPARDTAQQAKRGQGADVAAAEIPGHAVLQVSRAVEGMCAGRKRKMLAQPQRCMRQSAPPAPPKRSGRKRVHALAHLRCAAACMQPLKKQQIISLPRRALLSLHQKRLLLHACYCPEGAREQWLHD